MDIFPVYIISLSLQSSAIEQVLDILMDILSWEIAKVVSPCLTCSLWSHIVIRVFLLLGTVWPWHPPYPVLSSCALSRAFPYPQPGDAGGFHSAVAVCQSLTSADPSCSLFCSLFQWSWFILPPLVMVLFSLPCFCSFSFHFWPTILSVVPLVQCVVCLSVCLSVVCLWRFVLWQNGTS